MSEPSPPSNTELYEEFLRLFTRDQLKVLAFIRALIHDHSAASDVFQETSIELWRSFPSFRGDAEFAPWALGVARNQVLKHWRSRDRDRHVFSESLVNELAGEAIHLADELESRQTALNECVQQLAPRQQELIQQFYGANKPAKVIAESWNRTVHAVYKSLKVMRRSLLECVEQKLAEEA